MNDLTQRGIIALKSGDRAAARKMLAAALQEDQNDAMAWLWLAAAVDTEGQRIDCLRQVLKIDPANPAARKGLAALGVSQEAAPAQPAAVPSVQPVCETPVMENRPAEEPVEIQDAPAAHPSLAEALSPVAVSEPAASTASAPVTPPVSAPAPMATSVPASGPVAGYRPPRRPAVDEESARKIFNVRPSNVPALLAFWAFFIGAVVVSSQVSGINPGGTIELGPLEGMPFAFFGMIFGLGLGFLLELVVLYVVIRNMRTHYELTSASLTVPIRSRRTRIPVQDIYHVECHQSFFQRLIGAGDILLDAAVKGELAHLRLRSIPGCKQRVEEIAYLIQEST